MSIVSSSYSSQLSHGHFSLPVYLTDPMVEIAHVLVEQKIERRGDKMTLYNGMGAS